MQQRQLFDFARLADDERIVRRIADDANHLRVIRVAGHDDVPSLLGRALRQALHAGDERACGIDNLGRAGFELQLHQRRDAVGANHRDLVFRNFRRVLDG